MYETSGWVRRSDEKRGVIRVMVADDHPLVREGLCQLINMEDDLEVVATAADGQKVLDKVEQIRPDIILLDLSMPVIDGLAVLQGIQQLKLDSKVVLFTASEENQLFVEAMKLGCSGIVVKDTPPNGIMKAIRKVNQGEVWLDSQTTASVLQKFSNGATNGTSSQPKNGHPALSQRQLEITALVSQGFRNQDIANKLSISEQTVKNHLHNIFEKLEVSDRLELALYAIHNRLPLD